MKKTTKFGQPSKPKLALATEKLRPLTDDELVEIAGGVPNTFCRTCSCWLC